MTQDEFWSCIDQCRRHSKSIRGFNKVLERMLKKWNMPRLAAFA
jgi:hypothetical protein